MSALNIQSSAKGPGGSGEAQKLVSDCIWSGLRLALKYGDFSEEALTACRERLEN
jgi:hypothetical protein